MRVLAQENWHHHKKMIAILASPSAMVLISLLLIPLITIFLYSFGERIGFSGVRITGTIEHYARALQPDFIMIFTKSLWIAGGASLMCLLIAFPIAYMIYVAPRHIAFVLLVMITLPFWINILVRTYALIGLLGQRGMINSILSYLWYGLDNILVTFGFETLGRYPALPLLYNDMAIFIGIIYDFLPFMVLPIYLSLQKIDSCLYEASSDLGASFWHSLYHIILPLAMPGMVAGFMMVFIPSLGAFYIPAMLGGGNTQLIGNVIERQFTNANNYPLGAALSVMLILLMVISIIIRNIYEQKNERHYAR